MDTQEQIAGLDGGGVSEIYGYVEQAVIDKARELGGEELVEEVERAMQDQKGYFAWSGILILDKIQPGIQSEIMNSAYERQEREHIMARKDTAFLARLADGLIAKARGRS